MLRILESQAPAKQTADDTIATLSSRLSTATLLEDRRAAILGLRSFAKLFPASVASGALRDLIAALRRDGEDHDTIKVVLETLLMLFEPDEKSTEASEEITLWLADEFTQRQDNVTALLDLLDTGEFYLRLYSLQILSHVCQHRPQRAQETVLAAPLGVSRITSVLDDKREAVRNAALLLLVSLTSDSAELQKVVAFENAFERIFAIIQDDGGLTHGTTTTQDSLTLLANLLALNNSNQTLFRETGFVSRVSSLLTDATKEEESPDGVSDWARPQREMNIWGLLRIVQLFLVRGSQGTAQAQTAFWQHRVLLRILQLAFHQVSGPSLRARALDTCGDIIRGNASLQEQFGDLSVPLLRQKSSKPQSNGRTTPGPDSASRSRSRAPTPAPTETTNVIEALLELTLEPSAFSLFEVRLSACNCFKAFIDGHQGIRVHVLRRAVEGHRSGDDTIPNILTVLLEPSILGSAKDPYQVWMASVLLFHLLLDSSETKPIAMQISEGNAEEGEEVVTFIQSLVSNIVAGVQHVEDERALLGYLMLLCTWLFEDPDAVNDLLAEGSNVQGLVAAVKVSSASMPLVAGLCTVLLGIVYEFSTKDSPIPRSTVHALILKSLSREVYVDRFTKLRESPFVRDFEILPTGSDGGLPEVYFDKTFMDFLKDNFSRLVRAIDREPAFEASIVANGVQKGVSRELVDTLKLEVDQQKQSLETAHAELSRLQQKLEKEELEHRRTRESTSVELGRIKNINQSLQQNHDDEVARLRQELQRQQETLSTRHDTILVNLQREHSTAIQQLTQRHEAEKKYLEQRQSGHEREMTKTKEKHKTDLEQSQLESQRLQSLLQTTQRDVNDTRSRISNMTQSHEQEIQTIRTFHSKELQGAQARLSEAEGKVSTLQDQQKQAQQRMSSLEATLKKAEDQASDAETKRKLVEDRVSGAESRLRKAEDRAVAAESRAKKAEAKVGVAEAKLAEAEKKIAAAESRGKRAEEKLKKAEENARTASKGVKNDGKSEAKIKELEKELETHRTKADKSKDLQTELDDLLVVFADLEAKRTADKRRLKQLGEDVSEDEDEADDDEAELDDQEDDDVD